MMTDRLEIWKKRVTLWAREEVNKKSDSEPAGVNYHWGYHAGMVSMAKEAKEILDLLDNEE